MGSSTHNYICLVPLDQIQFKEGKRDIYTLLNLLQHKFEQSLIIEEGIYFFVIKKFIKVDATMNNFAYDQTI